MWRFLTSIGFLKVMEGIKICFKILIILGRESMDDGGIFRPFRAWFFLPTPSTGRYPVLGCNALSGLESTSLG